MKVVCVLLGALVALVRGQAYVSYYGQDLHHPVLSKESNTEEEEQLYQTSKEEDEDEQKDLLSQLLLKHYGFDGDEEKQDDLSREDLQHHLRKREIRYPVVAEDTPEVRKTKELHFVALAEAKARENPRYRPKGEPLYFPEVEPGRPAFRKHQYGYVPTIGKSGVPIDTPEVQFARERHLAAVAEVKSRQYREFIVEPKETFEHSFVEHPSQDEQVP